jgi:Ca2+-binding RTX toxin-like protein
VPYGTEGNDTIIGATSGDYIDGLGGDDWIESGDGSDPYNEFWGGAGNDTLIGGDGTDRLFADGGNDGGHDSLEGGAGFDVLTTWSGNDTLRGGLGGDTLFASFDTGESRTAWLYGEDGDDFISVGVLFDGGAGSVVASGGAGRDRFGFDTEMDLYPRFAYGLVVTDFEAGPGGDRIDLHGMLQLSGLHGRGYEGGNAFHAGQGYLRLVQSGADTLLQWDEDGVAGGAHGWHTVITLQGVEASSLTSENLDGMPSDGAALAGQVFTEEGYANVEGTSFDDTITGGTGGTLRGNGGHDWIKAGSPQSLYGGAGNDTLIGSDGRDVLAGQSGDDNVRGGGGNDDLRVGAGEGNDTLSGGDGDDFLSIAIGDAGGQRLVRAVGGNGNDRFSVSGVEGAGGDDVVVATGGAGQDTYSLWGSADLDLVVTDFTWFEDLLDPMHLLEPMGSDGVYEQSVRGCLRLVQDGAHTLLQFDADGRTGTTYGWKTVVTLRNVDMGRLSQYDFVAAAVTGTLEADTLQGGFGADTLSGGDGNDVLDGVWGSDVMEGGAGDDRYVVDSLYDVVTEARNGGTDTVVAHADHVLGAHVENLILASDALSGRGNGLDNSLRGNDLANLLHGAAGDDSLAGGSGGDTLSGGAGADQMRGDDGADVFRFSAVSDSPLASRDVILDFTRAAGGAAAPDKVDLAAIDAIAGTARNDAFTFIGSAEFSLVDASGQLRFAYDAGRKCVVLYGSVDADSEAEFAIELAGIRALGAADLLL